MFYCFCTKEEKKTIGLAVNEKEKLLFYLYLKKFIQMKRERKKAIK